MDSKGNEGWVKRRPLCGLAFFYVLGTLTGLQDALPWWTVAASALLALAGAILFRRHAGSGVWIAILLFLVAALRANQSVYSPSGRDLVRLLHKPSEFVRLAGRITDDPVTRPGRHPGQSDVDCHLEVEGLNRLGYWQRARGHVRVRWSRSAEDVPPGYGERWILCGVLKAAGRPRGAELLVRGASSIRLRPDGGSRLMAACLKARRSCRRILGLGLEDFPEQAGVLRALMLGFSEELQTDLRKDFSATGTLHIFAISGTHVGVVAVLFSLILRMLGVSRPHWAFYVVPMLLAYTMATGMAASAVRACIMAIVFMLGDFLARKADGWSSLALAALIILAFAPEQIQDLGFILSFSAVGGLMALYGLMLEPWMRLAASDDWQPDAQQAPERAASWRRRLQPVMTLAAASCAAWMATTPLSAYYFNLFSPVALPANLLVIPGAFVIMLTGGLAMITGWAHPWLAEVFNHANRVFISLLLSIIDWSASLPGGHLFVRAPPVWLVAVWYGILLVFPVLRVLPRRNLAAGCALCLGLAGAWWTMDRGRAYMDVIDVGQGNAALVNLPGDADFLVDTGGQYGVPRVLRHLRQEGVNRLAGLVVSHADAEHGGGSLPIMEQIPVGKIFVPAVGGRFGAFKELQQAAAGRGIPFIRLKAGQRLALSDDSELEALYPPHEAIVRRADDAGLVLRIAHKGASVLCMGDADRIAENRILNLPVNPCAQVLLAGAHGRDGATSAEWLDAVRPSAVIISVGAENVEGLPAAAVLRRIRGRGIPVYRTDEDGHCRIDLSGKTLPAAVYPLP